MASKDRKSRCLEALGALVLVLVLDANRMIGQVLDSTVPADDPEPPEMALRGEEWAIMDRLAQTYGSTDWSPVFEFLASNSEYAGNPNIAFIPLSLGNVSLNRYEWRHDTADFEQALQWFEWVAQGHRLWGHRWLAAPVVS